MPKYVVRVISTHEYRVPVQAASESEALAELDDYIASELADYEVYDDRTYEVEEVNE